MKPDFVDWEIVLSRLGMPQMRTVRIWCVPAWFMTILAITLVSMGVACWWR
ncbi:MAG: hypothetical protein Fur0019_19250 [Tibeticola sp.]